MTVSRCAVVLFERDEASEARDKKLPRAMLRTLRRWVERECAAIHGADTWIAATDGQTLRLRYNGITRVFHAASLSDQLDLTSQQLALEGYADVVFLASDIAVDRATIVASISALHENCNRAVIGQSFDGGFYLFAYSGALGFSWRDVALFTEHAATELHRVNRELLREVVLAPLIDDLDSAGAIPSFLSDLRKRGFDQIASELAGTLRVFVSHALNVLPSFNVHAAVAVR